MKLHVLLAIGLAFGLIVSTFAQQREPSPSEQDHAQIVAGGGGTTRGSSALKPISQSALQSMLDATARELLIPGAVVLLRTPQGEFTATYGTTQLGTKIPPTTDTYFRIASNTKTMTAAVIVQLAQEGKLKFSDPVSKYVAGVPNGDHITIAELLDMRSGLYNYLNAPELSKSADHDPTRVWTPAELLAIGFAQPPNFPPDTDYEYSNTNYVLLGLIVEKVEGKTLAQAMQDRLFGPLGMLHTALPPSNANALLAPYSHGYLYGSSSVAFVGEPPYSAAVRVDQLDRGPRRAPDRQSSHAESARSNLCYLTVDARVVAEHVMQTVIRPSHSLRRLKLLQVASFGFGVVLIGAGANPSTAVASTTNGARSSRSARLHCKRCWTRRLASS